LITVSAAFSDIIKMGVVTKKPKENVNKGHQCNPNPLTWDVGPNRVVNNTKIINTKDFEAAINDCSLVGLRSELRSAADVMTPGVLFDEISELVCGNGFTGPQFFVNMSPGGSITLHVGAMTEHLLLNELHILSKIVRLARVSQELGAYIGKTSSNTLVLVVFSLVLDMGACEEE